MLHLLRERDLPGFSTIYEALRQPAAADLARLMRVHPSTARRWIAAGDAPLPVRWALYWVSSHGQQSLNHELHYRASLYSQHIRAALDENDRLRRELARLAALADFGCANDASLLAPTPAGLLAQPPRRQLTATALSAKP